MFVSTVMLVSTVLRKKGQLIVPARDNTPTSEGLAQIATFSRNLESLGYVLDSDVVTALAKCGPMTARAIMKDALDYLVKAKGADKTYKPLYPNFPQQVMDASDAELYINALMHYFGDFVGLRILPVYQEEPREHYDFMAYEVIGLNTDPLQVVKDMVYAKSAMSEADRQDVLGLDINIIHKAVGLPPTNRENKAFVASRLWRANKVVPHAWFDTATDLLRFAAGLSGGDVSLTERTKFKLSKGERRYIMKALNDVKNPVEDMLRHEQQWKRLGEVIHPHEFNAQVNAVAAFRDLRNGNGVTFNAKTEYLMSEGNINALREHLVQRPGEYMRRLDYIVRHSKKADLNSIIRDIVSVGHLASSTVLLQAMFNFDYENLNIAKRGFSPKGNVRNMHIMKDARTPIDPDVARTIQALIHDALIAKFMDDSGTRLGKVYVDPALKDVNVPFALRNASTALKTLGRGSRVPVNADVVRLFTWWKDIEGADSWRGRVDIDLSAMFLDEQFDTVGYVTYYNLREGGVTHSGDITSAPDGAAEFIDVDIQKLRKSQPRARYVAMTIQSYSRQKFNEIPEVSAGFMERHGNAQDGEIFDARTVQNRFDIQSAATSATPLLFDLKERKMIWMDVSLLPGYYARGYGQENVSTHKASFAEVCEQLVLRKQPDLYTLFTAYATAHGAEFVDSPEKADIHFGFDGDVKPTDVSEILANYL